MRCRNCNGDLIYDNGIWTCSNCGSTFSAQEYYEDAEVYLCYCESDEMGRRTKDSAISQEIYDLLEGERIKTFYKRISVGNLAGEKAQEIDHIAASRAKVVLFIGTSPLIFSKLWEENKQRFAGKKLIPVYFGMNANEIPNEIRAIQSLKYDSLASGSDLLAAVFNAIGKKKEDQNYETLHKKAIKKRIIVIIAITVFVAIVMIIAIVVKTRRPAPQNEEISENIAAENEQTTEEPEEITESSIYAEAVEHMDQEKYAEAIKLFSELADYQDSSKLMQVCYAKYAGYYNDADTGVFFRLQMYEGSNGGIELYMYDENGEKCSISESVMLDPVSTDVEYTDSENNRGNLKVALGNKEISVTLKASETNSKVFFPDMGVTFSLDEKSDQPIVKMPTLDELKEMLNKKTTLGELKRQGYELSFEYALDPKYSDGENYYKFKNTDILVLACSYDVPYYYEYELHGDASFTPRNFDDPVIYGVEGPAGVMAPEAIGKNAEPFIDGEFMFAPGGTFTPYGYGPILEIEINQKTKVEDSTPVTVCCKETVGEEIWKYNLEKLFVLNPVKEMVSKGYPDSYPSAEICEEDDDKYTVYAKKNEFSDGEGILYYVKKSDYSITTNNETIAFLGYGNYEVSLINQNEYGFGYINDIWFEGDKLIINGSVCKMGYDGWPESTIKSDRIEININSDTEFYLWSEEGKNYITRDQFMVILSSTIGTGNSLGFSINANMAAEGLGLFP